MLRKFITVSIAAVSLNVAAMGPEVGGKATVRLTTSQIERLIARIANREITRRARRLRVGSAISADRANFAGSAVSAGVANTANSATSAFTAGTANRANASNVADNATFAGSANTAGFAVSASTAGFAASANPVRFANIGADGDVRPSRSKGIGDANVIRGSDGAYCFTGLPNVKGGMATVSGFAQPAGTTTQFTLGGGPGCNPNDGVPDTFGPVQFGVTIRKIDSAGGDTLSNEEFFLVLYE